MRRKTASFFVWISFFLLTAHSLTAHHHHVRLQNQAGQCWLQSENEGGVFTGIFDFDAGPNHLQDFRQSENKLPASEHFSFVLPAAPVFFDRPAILFSSENIRLVQCPVPPLPDIFDPCRPFRAPPFLS